MDDQYYKGYRPEAVSEKFYFKKIKLIKILLPLAPYVALLLSFHHSLTGHPLYTVSVSVFVVIALIIMLFLFTVPLVEVHSQGVRFPHRLFGSKVDVSYQQILGMSLIKIKQWGSKEHEFLRLLIRRRTGKLDIESLSMGAVNDAGALLSRLRRNVRELEGKHVASAVRSLGGPPIPERMKYIRWTLDEQGIHWKDINRKSVPWEDIQGITCLGHGSSLAGYLLITYRNKDGKAKYIRVGKSLFGGYSNFLRHLVTHAKEASIDPAVLVLLTKAGIERPYRESRSAAVPLVVAVAGIMIILPFIAPLSLAAYRLLIGSDKVLLLFGALGAWTVTFALSLALAIWKNTAKLWFLSPVVLSGLYNFGLVVIVGSFYLLNFSLLVYTLIGDVNFTLERYASAEKFYLMALKSNPGNQTLLVGFGEFYNETGDFEKAYDYLEKAYEIEPRYFTQWEVGLLLDSLTRQNRCDELRSWCERFIKDQPGNHKIKSKTDEYIRRIDEHRADCISE